MRICIVQTFHGPFDKRVFHKEAKSLAAGGHHVIVIAPSDTPLPEQTDGVWFVRLPEPKSFLQRILNAVRAIPKAIGIKADVYYCIDPEAWCVGVLIKAWTGRRLALDVHEYYPGDFAARFPSWARGFVSWAVTRVIRVTARCADHVVLAKQCIAFLYDGLKTPVTTVMNTNHLQPVCADVPEALRATYGSRPTIIHVGEFNELRGSRELLEAMKIVVKDMPNVKCILLGKYTGDEAAFRRAITDAGLEEHIVMPGVVPFGDVPAYIAVSKLGLVLFQPWVGLSHKYGMPHKMFDYMREEKPFVTTDFAVEIKSIVEEADCAVFVDVTRPQAIADGILALLRNPAEAERLGRNGRAIVEKKYNWQEDEKRLLAVFEQLAKRDE